MARRRRRRICAAADMVPEADRVADWRLWCLEDVRLPDLSGDALLLAEFWSLPLAFLPT